MKKKMLALLLAVAMVGTCLMACGGKANNDNGKQLTVQIAGDPETIDPALNSASDGGNMILHLFEGLLTVGQDEQLQAGCADLPEISEDGLTWTFKLKEGLKWSDGTDLTAEDFVYSWQRVCDPETAAPYAETVLGMVKGFDEVTETGDVSKLGVTAVDATTLKVELANPCTYFGSLAAFATLSPVQKATVEENGDAWAVDPEAYISNGPFKLAEFENGSHILMVKNENYWNADAIKLDSIKWLLIDDDSAAYAAYENGTAQVVKSVPTDEVPGFIEENRKDFYIDDLMGTYYVSLNLTNEAFKDVRVRKALSLAIDREHVANTVMQGTYSPAYNFMGPGWVDANNDPFMTTNYLSDDFEANLAEAKKLLAEAGYPDGQGFPTIEYMFNADGYHKPVAEYLQAAWQKLGLTVELKTVDWSQFTPTRRSGDYMVARNGWSGDYSDASNQLELFYSTNGNNDGKYNNPEFDKAMDDSRATADGDIRTAALHKCEDILMEDVACIPLAYYNEFWLQKDSVEGIWHSPRGYFYFMYADIPEA